MKKLLLITLLAVLPVAAQATTRLDPMLSAVVEQPFATQLSLGKSVLSKSTAGGQVVDCLVRAHNVNTVRDYINFNGGTVRTIAGDIMTAWVPVDVMADLLEQPDVIYVEAAKPLRLLMGDTSASLSNGAGTATNPGNARVVTKSDLVQAGTGTGLGGTAYNGSGVIVGVIDTGIDCLHPDFDDSSGNSRIISYWDQSLSGSGVAEVAGTGGVEYDSSKIISGACSASPDSDTSEGHGTHVTGIATSNNSTFKGIAPGASIIAVLQSSTDASSGGTFSSSVLDAVNYIFRKAQLTKKPAVVNISLGTSLGAHDDTSNFERGLNALLSGMQGRAIVNAAGNENLPSTDPGFATYGGIHAAISASAGSPIGYELIVRSSSASTTVVSAGGAVADIWLAAGGTCTIGVNAFAGSQKVTASAASVSGVAAGSSSSASDSSVTATVNFTDSANANNGKQHAQVTITRKSSSISSTILASYSFDLVFTGACSGNAWLYPDQTALLDFTKNRNGTVSTLGYTYVAGDSISTVTIPSTASSVIAVASFASREFWTDINGTTHDQDNPADPASTAYGASVNNISYFSSLGPVIGGTGKPDIAAPGEPIVSTLASTVVGLSSIYKGDATHHKLQGTSMASPNVVGVVALLLQRSGCLTPAQIRAALVSAPTTDTYTGSSPTSTIWGAGKVNALTTVTSVAAATCAPNNVGEDGAGVTAGLTTSSTSGGSSCTLNRQAGWNFSLLILFLPLLVVRYWRVKVRRHNY